MSEIRSFLVCGVHCQLISQNYVFENKLRSIPLNPHSTCQLTAAMSSQNNHLATNCCNQRVSGGRKASSIRALLDSNSTIPLPYERLAKASRRGGGRQDMMSLRQRTIATIEAAIAIVDEAEDLGGPQTSQSSLSNASQTQ